VATFNITVRGLDRSRQIPLTITRKLQQFRYELVPPLVEDFKRTEPRNSGWPKGRRKSLQDQTKGVIRGETIIIGTFNSRFARHLDTGGTVEPRKKKVMRFRGRDGQFIFTRKPITHHPRPYFGRVLSQVPSIVSRVYDRVFSDVTHGS
jgi:hypothetical protein